MSIIYWTLGTVGVIFFLGLIGAIFPAFASFIVTFIEAIADELLDD